MDKSRLNTYFLFTFAALILLFINVIQSDLVYYGNASNYKLILFVVTTASWTLYFFELLYHTRYKIDKIACRAWIVLIIQLLFFAILAQSGFFAFASKILPKGSSMQDDVQGLILGIKYLIYLGISVVLSTVWLFLSLFRRTKK